MAKDNGFSWVSCALFTRQKCGGAWGSTRREATTDLEGGLNNLSVIRRADSLPYLGGEVLVP